MLFGSNAANNLEARRRSWQHQLQALAARSHPLEEEIEHVTRGFDQIKNELLCMFERNAEAAKIRTHTNIVLHSEIPNSCFLGLQSGRRRQARIDEVISEEGTPSQSQENIVATHLAFQANLYSKKQIQESAKQTLLDAIKTRVTEEDTTKLNQPISKDEILMAIKSLGKNKATGTDGLSAEFYKLFADSLADFYFMVLEACYELREGH